MQMMPMSQNMGMAHFGALGGMPQQQPMMGGMMQQPMGGGMFGGSPHMGGGGYGMPMQPPVANPMHPVGLGGQSPMPPMGGRFPMMGGQINLGALGGYPPSPGGQMNMMALRGGY